MPAADKKSKGKKISSADKALLEAQEYIKKQGGVSDSKPRRAKAASGLGATKAETKKKKAASPKAGKKKADKKATKGKDKEAKSDDEK